MQHRQILGLLAGIGLTIALTACSSDDTKESSSSQSSPQPSAAAAAATAATTAAAAAPQAITVKSGEYFYEPKDFKVRPGTVIVTMTNEGPERPHTFTVKNKSGDGDLFKSERIETGKNVTLEFTVMDEGTYEVYCNLPGHADRGQRGTLTVSRT